ncbi:protease SohB [Pseudobdellovibrio exovorus]|uniref:Putative periplasmic protease n=1 Tax=Pseudobdellovibrio exovorus JSS TaxID=1184267 RepID=M4VAW8_9BACT|nr:protease SohB [Pseudobdellovibrio exovorus]AGH95615.1 putative periplasmic protease [Pseudobdellovibrio exovorus JSS]
MEILQHILLFFSQALIIVVSVIAVLITIATLVAKAKAQKSFDIELLHEKYEDQTQALKQALLNESELKAEKKRLKKEEKQKKAEDEKSKNKVFVVDFLKGDIKASDADHLREEVSTILGVASAQDEVVVRVESPGGLVHGYGFAAAQLLRFRQANIPLTICIDKVAASGGYLMACTANKVISAPFALVGSIGVVAQVPNFNRLLKKHDVDYKEYTAGEFKRTVSLFGEITPQGEAKFKEQLEETHVLFKSFVSEYRPQMDIAKVATGEFWYGENAIKLGLVDEIRTSDDYLLSKVKTHQIIKVSFEPKPTLSDKLSGVLSKALTQVLAKLVEQNSIAKKI